MTYNRVCSHSNTTDTTSGAGTAYPFSGVRVAQPLVFCEVFCKVLLSILI